MKITISAPDYFKEHKHLVKLLLSEHQKEFVKEAKAQIKEVKKQKEKMESPKRKR